MPKVLSVGDYVRMKYIKQIIPIRKGKCLDIGCGPGNYRELIESKGYEWTGIDAVSEGDKIIKSFAEKLPFDNESFDLAILVEVLEHSYNEKEIVLEATRILRPGGILIMHTPNKNQKHLLIDPEKHPEHVRVGFSVEELKSLLELAHLSHEITAYTFDMFEALAWDIGYSCGKNIPINLLKITDIATEGFEPYGILIRSRK